MRPRRRGWPGSLRVIRQLVNDPDPTMAATVGSIDALTGRGMDSRNGTIRIGEAASMHYKFTGYLTPHAGGGAPRFGAVTSLLHRPDTILPATSGPVTAAGRSVADVIADAEIAERF